MDIETFAYVLRRKWRLVLVCLMAGLVAGIGFSLMQTPMFESTARVFLRTPGWNNVTTADTAETSPYHADEFAQQRARSYARLASSEAVAARVIGNTKIPMDPRDLAANTSVHLIPDTVLLDINVQNRSPSRARELADGVSAELASEIRAIETPRGSLIPTVEPVVISPATTPRTLAEPHVAFNLIIGAAVGLLFGVSLAAASTGLSARQPVTSTTNGNRASTESRSTEPDRSTSR
ncbi:hypothetical protein FOS14_08350 [Skermania sp. ID1734]|uniref:YveK family protein n=1 Tax=Skermania sp. ID1734 TaxID=2597516 RepID=UPI00117F4037|nr:Wzz/FepE/Etk N-terminal domain-containing protein [Skermania sp. ID1734]TSE00418.1 hypothetical protein FOS14_08350 [Skermania sp. ID1734]